MKKYRFLIARRFTQLSIIALYILANIYGINILMGNLSSSLVLQTVTLSDPFAVLQMIFAGAIISFDIALGKAGDHYVQGWNKEDEKRVENATSETTQTQINKDGVVKSLNNSKDMEDLLK